MLTFREAVQIILASAMSEEDTWDMVMERCPDMDPEEFSYFWQLKKFNRKTVIQ